MKWTPDFRASPAPERWQFSSQYLPKEHVFHCLPTVQPPVLPLRDIYDFLKYRHQKLTIIDSDGTWKLRKTPRACETVVRLFEWESVKANRYKLNRQLVIAERKRKTIRASLPNDVDLGRWWYYPEECSWKIAAAIRRKRQLDRIARTGRWEDSLAESDALQLSEREEYPEIARTITEYHKLSENQEHLQADPDEHRRLIEYKSLEVLPRENYAKIALKAVGLSRANGWPDRPSQRRKRWSHLLESLLGIAVEHSS